MISDTFKLYDRVVFLPQSTGPDVLHSHHRWWQGVWHPGWTGEEAEEDLSRPCRDDGGGAGWCRGGHTRVPVPVPHQTMELQHHRCLHHIWQRTRSGYANLYTPNPTQGISVGCFSMKYFTRATRYFTGISVATRMFLCLCLGDCVMDEVSAAVQTSMTQL